MSSYFQSIRRLKDSHFYINALANQFALWKATQDQVDNPIYKAFSRATTNRLIFKEQAAAPILRGAEFWEPMVPSEPGPVGPIGAPPTGTVTVMINFDHELEDRSGKKNHAIFEFTNNQLLFADGQNQDLSFAVNFNPASNSTYDKLWIPFSDTTQIVYNTPTGFSIFCRIMPLLTTDLGTISSGPAPITNRIKYFGGPILNKYNIEVWNIWWGNEWTDSSTPWWGGGNINAASVKSTAISCIDAIANSEYYDALWSTGWPDGFKRLATPHHVNHTTTSLPGSFGSNCTLGNIEQVVRNAVTAGQVPNYDLFGETATDKDGTPNPTWLEQVDYRHIYFVHIPPSRRCISGASGFAFRGLTPGTGNVWFLYNGGEVYPSYQQWNGGQATGSLWSHEVFHHLESIGFSGCSQAVDGYGYSTSGEACSSRQHCTTCGPNSDGGCGAQHLQLQNSNALVTRYWSDMDGKCIAPGTGESWVHPPTATEPTGPIVRRYIFQKLDDLDNGATAAMGSSGTVFFNVKKAGIEYKVKTAAGVVRPNEWADCWFVWNTATNTPTIYINNVKYTTASTEALLWNNTHSHTIIGNYNVGATIGQFRGRMDDFRLYRSGVVEDAQVDNFAGNGLTITGGLDSPPSAEQGVFIVNRVKIDKKLENSNVFVPGDVETGDVPAATSSFTTTSFTATSFTI